MENSTNGYARYELTVKTVNGSAGAFTLSLRPKSLTSNDSALVYARTREAPKKHGGHTSKKRNRRSRRAASPNPRAKVVPTFAGVA
jgi:hypothetical protein